MNTKKAIALFLSLVFLLTFCACGAEEAPSGTLSMGDASGNSVSFDGGDGTPEDPYRISTGEQMHELSRLANASYDSPYLGGLLYSDRRRGSGWGGCSMDSHRIWG